MTTSAFANVLRSELLIRSPRGRVATAKAYEHLQIAAPAALEDAQGKLFA